MVKRLIRVINNGNEHEYELLTMENSILIKRDSNVYYESIIDTINNIKNGETYVVNNTNDSSVVNVITLDYEGNLPIIFVT
jgi:hypothetical protein